MKTTLLKMLTISSLLILGTGLYAETKIIIKEKPVEIIREGQTYTVTGGFGNTSYFTYMGDTGTMYCTSTVPSELVSVNGSLVELNSSGMTKKVYCYPSSYFTIQTP